MQWSPSESYNKIVKESKIMVKTNLSVTSNKFSGIYLRIFWTWSWQNLASTNYIMLLIFIILKNISH